MTDSLIRPKLQSDFGLGGQWGGDTRRPVDPGTRRSNQRPARRSRAGAGPRFGDPGEGLSHDDRLRAMIGGDR